MDVDVDVEGSSSGWTSSAASVPSDRKSTSGTSCRPPNNGGCRKLPLVACWGWLNVSWIRYFQCSQQLEEMNHSSLVEQCRRSCS